jgi:hypothetical protein
MNAVMITGMSGAGKSTIAAVLAHRGLASIDADDDPLLARSVDLAGNVVEDVPTPQAAGIPGPLARIRGDPHRRQAAPRPRGGRDTLPRAGRLGREPRERAELMPRQVTFARVLSCTRGGQPEARPRLGVVRAPAGTLASRTSPVTGRYPAQPPRCDIVAVLTATMWHRSG